MTDRTLILLVILIAVLFLAILTTVSDNRGKQQIIDALSPQNLELARQAREWERMARSINH